MYCEACSVLEYVKLCPYIFLYQAIRRIDRGLTNKFVMYEEPKATEEGDSGKLAIKGMPARGARFSVVAHIIAQQSQRREASSQDLLQ